MDSKVIQIEAALAGMRDAMSAQAQGASASQPHVGNPNVPTAALVQELENIKREVREHATLQVPVLDPSVLNFSCEFSK